MIATKAMLARRDIHVHPLLVLVITEFAFRQLVNRRMKVLAGLRFGPTRHLSMREHCVQRLTTIYTKAHVRGASNHEQSLKERYIYPRFPEDFLPRIMEIEQALRRRIQRKDRATRLGKPGGWKSVLHRDREKRRLDALKRVIFVVRQ